MTEKGKVIHINQIPRPVPQRPMKEIINERQRKRKELIEKVKKKTR
ncbi:hypothetical protein [Desertibacillus haloalkaliphilus]|nr:hypothetical protein [Desertibacillus haloalkaliphilus]MBU8908172.1 hypothetical protein [Desertibacillus haloalkaliphilus]